MAIVNLEFLTKVLPPRRRPDVLRRQQLLDFLHAHIHLKTQVISSPAGYGKTTLLVDFASDADIPVCWYTLDASDQDPAVFFDTLLTSIRCSFPNFGRKTEAHLKTAADIARDSAHIIGLLTGEMHADIPELFVLVLEDYHSIEADSTIRSIVDRLLDRTPDNCHIIISSRTPLELPNLSKLCFRRQAARLGQRELSFTAVEVRQLLVDHFKMDISEAAAEKLVADSEGWIAGILLGVSTSFADYSIPREAALSAQDVFNYLASEIYGRQLPEIKEFLLLSSTFPEIEPQICDRLFKLACSDRLLQEIEKGHLFLSRLEGERLVYRYHNLFRIFLQKKLKESRPEAYILLHKDAGRVFEEAGQWSQAIDHYLTAGAYGDILRILTATGESFLRKGRWKTVSSWLQAVPEQERLSEPAIGLLEAESLIHLGKTDVAIHLLNGLLKRLEGGTDWLSAAKAFSWRSAAFRLTGHLKEALSDVRKAIKLLRIHKGPANVLAEAYRRLGIIYAEQGQLNKGEKCLKRSLKFFLSVFDVSQIAAVHNALGVVYKRLGALHRAIAHYEEARQYWEKAQNQGALALTLNNLGVAYRRQGQYDLALNLLRSGLEKSRLDGYVHTQATISNNLGDVKRDLGLYDEAMAYYSQALELANQVLEPYRATIASVGMGITYRLRGDLDKSEALLNEATARARELGQDYDANLFTLQLGILRYQRGKHRPAQQLLQDVYDRMERLGDKDTTARCALHLAYLSYLGRKYQTALTWLRRVSALVEELGYWEFLAVESRGMSDLLRYAISKRLGGDLWANIVTRAMEQSRPAKRDEELSLPSATEAENLPQIRVSAFGQLAVSINSKTINDSEWRSAKAREMFFYLLCRNGHAGKEQIVSSLWPDVSTSKGNSLFHSNLYRLRHTIGEQAIIKQNGKYLVDRGLSLRFDIWEFESNLSKAAKPSLPIKDKQSYFENALEVYKGPFLQEFYTDWVEALRGQLEARYLRALCSLASCHRAQGDHDRAIELLEKAAAIDPYLEEAYFEIIKSYSALGDTGSAWGVYRRYSSVISQELGCEHSPKMEGLIRSFLTKHPTMT